VTATSRSPTLLRSPWTASFHGLLSEVEKNLLLVSPFVKLSKAQGIVAELEWRGVHQDIHVEVLTDLRPESALNGSTDLEAFVEMGRRLPSFGLTHLPSLHAKVYVADRKTAIVTSGNLTDPGLSGNLEYGVIFTDEPTVEKIRTDFEKYALLGARVPWEDVRALLDETRELKELLNKADRTIHRRARRAFKEKLAATRIRLLRHRAKGKTTSAIFSETILFLLSKGPLTTVELHPLIQRLHPDICDDTIELVIDGVHFGKKWKHRVRNAQQWLKREGKIRFDGERWHIAS